MLIFDLNTVGGRLLSVRKQAGLTQAEVAELAGLSDRTYTDIERGTVNMRIETLLRICKVLHITPDALLTVENPSLTAFQEELLCRLEQRSTRERETALQLLSVYLRSLS